MDFINLSQITILLTTIKYIRYFVALSCQHCGLHSTAKCFFILHKPILIITKIRPNVTTNFVLHPLESQFGHNLKLELSITVWKFNIFPASKVSREIHFCEFWKSKYTNMTRLTTLNFELGEFLHFTRAEIYKNQNLKPQRLSK